MQIKLAPSIYWRFVLFLFQQSAACPVFSMFSLEFLKGCKATFYICMWDACILLSCDNLETDMIMSWRMILKRKKLISVISKLAVLGRNVAKGFSWGEEDGQWRLPCCPSADAEADPLFPGTCLFEGAGQGPATSLCTLRASAPASPARAECRRKKSGLLLK